MLMMMSQVLVIEVFARGTFEWGIDVLRFYPRDNSHRISNSPQDRNIECILCQMPKFRGFDRAEPGRDLEITPTLVTTRTGTREELTDPLVSGDVDPEFGLDVNWGIQKPGGVRVYLSNIPFNSDGEPLQYDMNGNVSGNHYSNVTVQLIGDHFFDGPNDPSFLPTGTETKTYYLTKFWTTGKTAQGTKPRRGCVKGGSAPTLEFLNGIQNKLTIRVKPPTASPE